MPRISFGAGFRNGLRTAVGRAETCGVTGLVELLPRLVKYVAPPAIAAATPATTSTTIARLIRRRRSDCRRRSRKRSLGSIRSWRNIPGVYTLHRFGAHRKPLGAGSGVSGLTGSPGRGEGSL